MISEASSWLHDTGKLTLRYLAVGMAFIPAGLVYDGFRKASWDTPFSVALSVGFGFWTAYYVWNWLENRERVAVPPITKELALLLSDSGEGNWTDAVDIRRKHAEEAMVFLYDVKSSPQWGEQLQTLLSHRTTHRAFLNISIHSIQQSATAPKAVLTTRALGAPHAAFGNTSS